MEPSHSCIRDLKKEILKEFPSSFSDSEADCLIKLDPFKGNKYPDKDEIIIFREEFALSADFRFRDPKDPLKTVRTSYRYSPAFPEDINSLMNQFYSLLHTQESLDDIQVLRSAHLNYFLFFLIHPYEDGNKRTAAYILQSRIGFPFCQKWGNFSLQESREKYESAHLSGSETNWDYLANNFRILSCYFTLFYGFSLNTILKN